MNPVAAQIWNRDNIPFVGHLNSLIYYIGGQRRLAVEAYKCATHNTGVVCCGVLGGVSMGGIGGICLGVLGGVCNGVVGGVLFCIIGGLLACLVGSFCGGIFGGVYVDTLMYKLYFNLYGYYVDKFCDQHMERMDWKGLLLLAVTDGCTGLVAFISRIALLITARNQPREDNNMHPVAPQTRTKDNPPEMGRLCSLLYILRGLIAVAAYAFIYAARNKVVMRFGVVGGIRIGVIGAAYFAVIGSILFEDYGGGCLCMMGGLLACLVGSFWGGIIGGFYIDDLMKDLGLKDYGYFCEKFWYWNMGRVYVNWRGLFLLAVTDGCNGLVAYIAYIALLSEPQTKPSVKDQAREGLHLKQVKCVSSTCVKPDFTKGSLQLWNRKNVEGSKKAVQYIWQLKPGDHVVYGRGSGKSNIYDHHAIVGEVYPGNGTYTVYERSPNENWSQAGKASIKENFKIFDSHSLYSLDHRDTTISKVQAKERAHYICHHDRDGTLSETYNLVINNCEHFANFCATGEHKSHQILRIYAIVEKPLAMIFTGILVWIFFGVVKHRFCHGGHLRWR